MNDINNYTRLINTLDITVEVLDTEKKKLIELNPTVFNEYLFDQEKYYIISNELKESVEGKTSIYTAGNFVTVQDLYEDGKMVTVKYKGINGEDIYKEEGIYKGEYEGERIGTIYLGTRYYFIRLTNGK